MSIIFKLMTFCE